MKSLLTFKIDNLIYYFTIRSWNDSALFSFREMIQLFSKYYYFFFLQKKEIQLLFNHKSQFFVASELNISNCFKVQYKKKLPNFTLVFNVNYYCGKNAPNEKAHKLKCIKSQYKND